MGAQANAYPGGFTLNAGTVITTGTKVFGSSPITFNGGTLQSTFSTAGSFSGLSLTIGGDFSLAGAGQTATFPMNVSLGSATRTITNSTTAGGRIFSGVISGGAGAGMTFAGAGVTTLGGANMYTGDTTVSSGGALALGAGGSIAGSPNIAVDSGATFDVSAVSGYKVGSGQTLKGSGLVKGTVAVDGTASPGDSSIGTLSFGGNLTLNSGSTLSAEINSGAGTADLLNVVGDLSLMSGATLNLSDLGSSLLTVGTKLKLIGYGGSLIGTFSGKLDESLLNVGANRFVINYDDTIGGSKYVTLTSAVPEARAFWYAAMLASVVGLAYVTRTALLRRPEGPRI